MTGYEAHWDDIRMHTLGLNGNWSVRPAAFDCMGEAGAAAVRQATDGWIEAQVPGEAHLGLVRAGQMPDPSVGANMPKCRWPETKSWWYRTVFDVGADFLGHNESAVRWQVWTALLAYVLLRFIAYAGHWGHAFARLFSLLRGVLWECLDLFCLVEGCGTATSPPPFPRRARTSLPARLRPGLSLWDSQEPTEGKCKMAQTETPTG
jgi:hypothetical protein